MAQTFITPQQVLEIAFSDGEWIDHRVITDADIEAAIGNYIKIFENIKQLTQI